MTDIRAPSPLIKRMMATAKNVNIGLIRSDSEDAPGRRKQRRLGQPHIDVCGQLTILSWGRVMIPIFLVGGSRLFRAGLRLAIESAEIKVIGECSDDDETKISSAMRGEGSILLFKPGDLGEVGGQTASLRRLEPKAQVVVILSKLTIDDLIDAFAAGADGLVLEDISSAALRESLRLIKLGEKIFPSQLAALLGGERRSPLFRMDRSESITKRELEILNCLAVGMCNKSIAAHLGLAVGTVKVHVKSLLKKLALNNRTQAAIWAVNAGLVPAPSVLLQSAEPPEGRVVHLHAEPAASVLN